MNHRYIPPVLRQVGLVCEDTQFRFGLLLNEAGQLAIPLISVDPAKTFLQASSDYCARLGVGLALEGIVGMESGNDGANNYFRCLYYGKVQEGGANGLVLTDLDGPAPVHPYTYRLLKQLQSSRRIYSLDLFREEFKEIAPRQPDLRFSFSI